MRTWDNIKGQKITEIIYEHEPDGIGFNKLKRISGYAKNTIGRWLNRLRIFGVIKKTPKYPIHMTEKAIQEYRKHSFFLPYDRRRRQKNIWSEKEKKSIIHGLSLMALGVYRPQYKVTKTKLYVYKFQKYPFFSHQSVMDSGKTIYSISLKNKRAFLSNTDRINNGRYEVFGYLNLTLEEAQQIFEKLLKHNPPIIKPLKVKYNKTRNEIRYTIADDLLKEFVANCILSFNLYVRERLKLAYVYNLFYAIEQENYNFLKKGEMIKEYKRYMKIWYGYSTKTYGSFDMIKKRKQQLNIKKDERSELIRHYKKVIDEWDKIKNKHIFDEEFKNVNVKYKSLLDKYGLIVNIFLEILFPQFLREIWRKKIT